MKAIKQHKPAEDDGPLSAPNDIKQSADDTDPQTDTTIDSDEVYHHGLEEAAGLDRDSRSNDEDTIEQDISNIDNI